MTKRRTFFIGFADHTQSIRASILFSIIEPEGHLEAATR
jgi:hypothetical protein